VLRRIDAIEGGRDWVARLRGSRTPRGRVRWPGRGQLVRETDAATVPHTSCLARRCTQEQPEGDTSVHCLLAMRERCGRSPMMDVVMRHGRDGPSTRVRVFEWLDRIRVPAVVGS
jgi:hypothetical protein